MYQTLSKYLLIFFLLGLIPSCKDDEVPLPDLLAQFDAAEQGISDTESSISVTLKLSREAPEAIHLEVSMTPDGLSYGTEFTTIPTATNNQISLTIPKGATEVQFEVQKAQNIFLNGTESIEFALLTASSPALLGSTTNFLLKFGSIVSTGSDMQLNGLKGAESGSSAANSVFVDLSNNQQLAVERASWDLGFYTGDDFRVILNNTTSATTRATAKTDLNQVTASDTIPASNWSMGYTAESFELIDDITGDLSKTVIAAISSNDSENKVYILNRGTGGGVPARRWWKIRVLRKGSDGYTLQYAPITSNSFQTIDIAKDPSYHFNYVFLGQDNAASQTAQLTAAEPVANNWDFKWGYSLYETALGAGTIPYAFSDLIAINHRSGVMAAEVSTSTVSYENFSEQHIGTITFEDDLYAIGANWRVTSSATEPIGVRTDRFYVIKDPAGNVYKIKFISFHANDGGERGKPKFEYQLVKKTN
ncbi:heme-binding HmuY-like protein [Dyadobacter jejuensis]|uniref:Heme-binding HmuY-like protein n=1 Tax=Dyadobacter jejuensis TaxID=1082580 RepID=A0A316B2D2_9BACT|nr:HmuY family protein [Dyadobacter jejuensis]PWJ56697.1 heme-binding HmuY-like protein [Dyadobacter jejuensis]